MLAYRLVSTQSGPKGSECWWPLLKTVVVAFLVSTTYLNKFGSTAAYFRESVVAGRSVRWPVTLHPSVVRRQREGHTGAQYAFFFSSPVEPHSTDGTTYTQGKPSLFS